MLNEKNKLGVGGIEDVTLHTAFKHVKQWYILFANTNGCGDLSYIKFQIGWGKLAKQAGEFMDTIKFSFYYK